MNCPDHTGAIRDQNHARPWHGGDLTVAPQQRLDLLPNLFGILVANRKENADQFGFAPLPFSQNLPHGVANGDEDTSLGVAVRRP